MRGRGVRRTKQAHAGIGVTYYTPIHPERSASQVYRTSRAALLRIVASLGPGWRFFARWRQLEGRVSEAAVDAALLHSRTLAVAVDDEPAALFYAFACSPKALVGGWREMPARLALNQAAALGRRFTGSVDELAV